MTRLITSVTVAAALALGLTGCGGSAAEKTAAPSTTIASAATTSKVAKKWITVFEFTARQGEAPLGAESAKFMLDGQARLRYTVTAAPNRPDGRGRVADIGFQDVKLDTESSHVDTMIDVDEPGTATKDLGSRKGTYFLMLWARGGTVASETAGGVPRSGWRDTVVTVVVEQLK